MSENTRVEMSRAFQSLGLFKPDEIVKGFRSGQFTNGDYGRREDSSEWKPVEAIVSELDTKDTAPASSAAPKKGRTKVSTSTKH